MTTHDHNILQNCTFMFIVHAISPYRHRIFLCFFGGILEGFWGNTRALGPAVPGEEGWPVAADPEGSALHVPWHTSSDGKLGSKPWMLPDASGLHRVLSINLGAQVTTKRDCSPVCCAIAVPLPLRKSNVGSKAGADGFHSRDEGGCTQCMLLLLWWLRARAEQHWLCSTGEGWGKKSEVRAGENYKEQLNKDESVNQWKFLFRLKSLCHSVISHSRKPKNRRDSWVGFVASIERRPSCAWKRIFAASQGHKCYAAFAAPSGAFPSRPAARSNHSSLDV